MAKSECSIPGCSKPSLARGWCRTHYTRWYETGSTELGLRPHGNFQPVTSLADRFWAKVNKTDSCWLWTGGTTQQGYGVIWSGPNGRNLMAHRVSWEMAHEVSIPDDLHIDHLCRVPACVNPEHLEPVTRAENAQRGLGGLLGAERQRSKTHCPQDHPYDEENTYINKRGARMCRACIRIRQRARRAAGKQRS